MYMTVGQARGGLSKYEKLGIGIGASVMGIVIIVLGICTWKLRRRAEQAEKQAKPFGESQQLVLQPRVVFINLPRVEHLNLSFSIFTKMPPLTLRNLLKYPSLIVHFVQ